MSFHRLLPVPRDSGRARRCAHSPSTPPLHWKLFFESPRNNGETKVTSARKLAAGPGICSWPPPPSQEVARLSESRKRIMWPPPSVSFFPSTSSRSLRFPGGEMAAVASPSTVCFNSSYNVQIVVDDIEQEERLLNRFRREVMRAGVIQECRQRRYFENKKDEKKRRTRDAAKRNRKRFAL